MILITRYRGSRRAFDVADVVARARGLQLFPDQRAVRLPEQERADEEGHGRDGDGVVETRVDVPGHGDDPEPDEREDSAEDAVADVVGERERRVAYPRGERFDEVGRNR